MRTARTVRLLDRVDEGVERLASQTGRNRSAVVNELLEEGLRMRRFPGITFADGASGRVARLAGTGIDVWEVVASYHSVDRDWKRLHESYSWLPEVLLRAALAYAEAYPEEISRRLAADEYWTPERTWETYPFMRPRPSA